MEGGDDGGRAGDSQSPDAGRSDRDFNWRTREDVDSGGARGRGRGRGRGQFGGGDGQYRGRGRGRGRGYAYRDGADSGEPPIESAEGDGTDAYRGGRGGGRGRGRGRGGYWGGQEAFVPQDDARGGFRGGYRGRGRGRGDFGGPQESGYRGGRGGRGGYYAGRGRGGEGEEGAPYEFAGGRGRGGYRGRGGTYGDFRGRGGRGGYGRGGGGRPADDGSIPAGSIFAFVLVTQSKIGLVRGKGSERLLALQERTRTTIRCPTEDGFREGALYEERMTKVIGPPSGVERAVMEVLHIIGDEPSAVKFAIEGESALTEAELRACLERNGLGAERVKATLSASVLGTNADAVAVKQTTVDLEGRGYDLQKALALVACMMHFLDDFRAGSGPVVREIGVAGAALGMLLGQRARELHDVEGRAGVYLLVPRSEDRGGDAAVVVAAIGLPSHCEQADALIAEKVAAHLSRFRPVERTELLIEGRHEGDSLRFEVYSARTYSHIEDRQPHVLRTTGAGPTAALADESEAALRSALAEALSSVGAGYQGKLALKARFGRVVFHSLPTDLARSPGLSAAALADHCRQRKLRHVFEAGSNPADRNWLSRLGFTTPGRGGIRYAVSVEDTVGHHRLRFRYEVEPTAQSEEQVLLALTGDKTKKLVADFVRPAPFSKDVRNDMPPSDFRVALIATPDFEPDEETLAYANAATFVGPEHLSSNNINLPFNDRRFQITAKRLKRKTVYEAGEWVASVTEADVRDARQHRTALMVTLQHKPLTAALRPAPDAAAVLARLPAFLAKAREVADALRGPMGSA